MYRTAAVVILAWTFLPAVASGQERSRGRGAAQGIPPGHLPPPGECRVWYEGRPPGKQPRPTDCRTAENVARRDRHARVVYGGDRSRESYRYGDGDYRGEDRPRDRERRDDEDRERGRAVPRGMPYPTYPGYPGERYPQRTPERDGRRSSERDHPGWETGYRDGLVKGREDSQKNRSYQPDRHQWYRSASRGYDRRYGVRGAYANVYRDGFEAGYAEAFRRY